MANWYISSVAYLAVPTWQQLTGGVATNVAVGTYVRNTNPAAGTSGADYHRLWKCTTAGTTGTTEPAAWSTTNPGNDGSTTTDGTVVWTEVMGRESEQAAGNWKAPAFSGAALRFAVNLTNGDTLFYSSDHAESGPYGTSGYMTGSPNLNHISVSRTGASLPPTAADEAPGASITFSTGANNTFTLGTGLWKGISIKGGDSGTINNVIAFSGNNAIATQKTVMENCDFYFNSTGTGNGIKVNSAGLMEWINTNVHFNGGSYNSGAIQLGGAAEFIWRDSPNAFQGTMPTGGHIFDMTGGNGGLFAAIGCDFSNAISGGAALFNYTANTFNVAQFKNCKMAPLSTVSQGFDFLPAIAFDNCDTGPTGYKMTRFYNMGRVDMTSSVYHVGGASDGNTPFSLQFSSINDSRMGLYVNLQGPELAVRQNATGVAKTLTVEMLWNGAAPLTNAQAWIEAEVLDNAGAPISSRHSSRAPSTLSVPTSLTASTESWSAPARANSTAYAVGQPISVPDNAGRVFFCTVAGTSAAAEPAAYASAVDGGTVTDGTATFRAAYRLKASVTFTPQMPGMVVVTPKFGVPSSVANFFVDPALAVA